MLSGVTYERIDDAGLHVRTSAGKRVLAVDSVVICAGQEPLREFSSRCWRRGCGRTSSVAPT